MSSFNAGIASRPTARQIRGPSTGQLRSDLQFCATCTGIPPSPALWNVPAGLLSPSQLLLFNFFIIIMGVKNVNWNRITNKNVIKQKFPSYTIIFPIHILIIPRGASHDESTALTGLNILFIWIVVSNNTFINYSQAGKTSIPQLYNSLSYW